MPTVIPETSIDNLTCEIRLFNVTKFSLELQNMRTDEAWQTVRIMKNEAGEERFPLLCRLSAAICAIFHGNADTERYIGKSHDIDASEKRSSLAGKLSEYEYFNSSEIHAHFT